MSVSTWLKPLRATRETRLRELQWKLLHNIYPTNIILAKMKIEANDKCSYCPNQTDYIEHFFFECPSVKSLWKKVEGDILRITECNVRLSAIDVMFGIQNKDMKARKIKSIDHILLIAKMCVSIKKKTSSPTPLCMIYEYQLSLRERYFRR